MTAYYNEFDPKAAAWLRELIRCGLIADGVVDERSILDVQPADLAGFTQCHFFAGVGGWSLALRLAGWPDSRPVWTGSPPCQPFSAAGRQLGRDDERHLAPHFASLVAAGRPDTLFGEQVASAAVFGKATSGARKAADVNAAPEWAWLDDLFERLEAAHYACGASDIPAAGVGAAHIRQRTFFGAQRMDDPAGPRHDGPFAGPEGLARNETWLRLSGTGSGLVRLEHPAGDGRQQRRAEPSGWGASRRCGHVELADGHDAGLEGWREPGCECSAELAAGAGSVAGGVAVSDDAKRRADAARRHDRSGQDTRRAQGSGHAEGCGRDGVPSPTNGIWRDADWLYCRDGKWRPVEPSTFPLASGLPARVVRLRGYGNAIVPQAAAEFIKAFDAASAECFRLNDLSETPTDNGVFG